MGTLIGGGVLALPLVSSGASFLAAGSLLTLMWALMFFTGLLFIEVTLAFPFSNINFSSMASQTIGKIGKILTALSYLILLYSLVGAYISAGGSLLNELLLQMNLHLPIVFCSLIFVLVLATVVFHGINAVDYFNRVFFSLKGIFLVLVIGLSIPKMELSKLIVPSFSYKYLWAAAPIFLCSFGYHILIPVLSEYLNYDKKNLIKVLFMGSFLTWALYLLWLAVTMGIVPLESFLQLSEQKGSVGEFISQFSGIVKNRWIIGAVHGFANITVITCFLGVSLGLFNFLADFLKKQKNRSDRLQITLYTFIPPIIFVLFYPKGFILALGNAAISVAFSHVMLPAWMVFKLRKKKIETGYRACGGNFVLATVFLIGLAIIILQLLVDLDLLAIFGK